MPRQGKPRSIHPSCSTSLSLANLSPLAELLFYHMIANADDQGRLPGDLRVLKALVCPMREEITRENINTLLDEIENQGMILRYSDSNGPVIQIRNWWKHQSPQWSYPSEYAPPPGWVDHLRFKKGGAVHTSSWPPAGEPSGEALGEASRDTTGKDTGDPVLAQLSQLYEKEIGVISAAISQELTEFATEYKEKGAPLEWINEAFKEAAAMNKRNWKYVKAILVRWMTEGKQSKTHKQDIVEERMEELAKQWEEEHQRLLEQESSAE